MNTPVSPDNTIVETRCGEIRRAHDFARVVDPDCLRVITTQGAEVLHPSISPKESMGNVISRKRGHAENLAAIVNALRNAVRTSEFSKVDHCAVYPQEWVQSWDSRGGIRGEACIRLPDDDAGQLIVAPGTGWAIRAAECPAILKVAILPKERSHLCTTWEKCEGIGNVVVSEAHHLSSIVDRDSDTRSAPRKSANVHKPPAFPEHGMS